MPTFTVMCRQDAFVNYVAQVKADTPEQAVDIAYADGGSDVKWEHYSTVEFDAREVVALDADFNPIEGVSRGDF